MSEIIKTTLMTVSKTQQEMSLRDAFGMGGRLANPALALFGLPRAPENSLVSDPSYGRLSWAIRHSPGWMPFDDGLYDGEAILVLNKETISSAIEALRQGDKFWGNHLVRVEEYSDEYSDEYDYSNGDSRRSRRRRRVEDEIWELTGGSPCDYVKRRKEETGDERFILSNREILAEIKGY